MSTAPAKGRLFPETDWSRLRAAGDQNTPGHREQLDRLLRRYWKPAYHYVRALRRLDASEAEDVTQGFFAMLLARVDLTSLRPDKGTFRAFLKTALRRFVLSAERKKIARQRHESLAFSATGDHEDVATGDLPADEAFDRAWAREVVDQALTELRASLCTEGKELYWQLFHDYCIDPATGVSYATLAARHGIKEDDVRNHLHAVRQRCRTLMRRLVEEYVLPGEDPDEELLWLLSA